MRGRHARSRYCVCEFSLEFHVLKKPLPGANTSTHLPWMLSSSSMSSISLVQEGMDDETLVLSLVRDFLLRSSTF